MPETEPLAVEEALRHLSQLVLQNETLDTTLQRVVEVAVRAVPTVVGVSITLKKGQRPYTAVATSPQVTAIDHREYDIDEGPCISALETGELQLLDDVGTPNRWPRFAQVCREEGLASSLGVPLRVGEETWGAMNLYAAEPHAFDEEHQTAASLLAQQAAVALANKQSYDASIERIRQLEEALESRIVIEQAKGILMVTEGVDEDGAFELLKQRSQKSNRKLRLVAEEVVRPVAGGARLT